MLYQPDPHHGQGLLEYALIIMLMALVVISLLFIFGPSVGNMFSNVVSSI
jgi:pilus assembly protein Flp/PilA